jgi:hypothetical protein
VFVYRGLRLCIGKPFFSNEAGAKSVPIRSLGILNEDGTWVYYLGDLDANLENAEWQARHYVVDSMKDLVFDGKYPSPDSALYSELQLLTNSSRDKTAFRNVQDFVSLAKSTLDDAWERANAIKDPQLKNKALDMVLSVERWFD